MADKVPQSARIADGFYLISFGFVAMYVFDAGDCLIAFDAGMRPATLLAEFAKLGLDPSRVRHVFLTHSDMDHTGGLSALANAQVYLSRDELPMVTRKVARFFTFIFNKPLAAGYQTLGDGEERSVGNARIRSLTTPGHTPGSMSFLINEKLLIAGDILNLDKGKAVMDRAMINMNKIQRKDSIRKIARLSGISLLCTMHSGFTADFPGAMKDWQE